MPLAIGIATIQPRKFKQGQVYYSEEEDTTCVIADVEDPKNFWVVFTGAFQRKRGFDDPPMLANYHPEELKDRLAGWNLKV